MPAIVRLNGGACAHRLIQINPCRAPGCLMYRMVDPISSWHADHKRFVRLLELLDKEVVLFHSGEQPNYELMRDIVLWLRHYADGVHHPRENVAFERMAQRDPPLRVLVNRLLQEHRIIANAGEWLLERLEDAANGGFAPRAELEAAAATFLAYYRSHMATEDGTILPRAAKLLQDADWAAVTAVVPQEDARTAEALRVARGLDL
jgi:hemerythrin-like domain-containing protein